MRLICGFQQSKFCIDFKQLERVLNEYTPQSDMKKKTYVSSKPSDKVP